MSLFTIYHNPKCSKSCKTLKILQDHGKEINIINYLQTPLEATELKEICQKLNCKIQDIVRVKEDVFSTLNLDFNNSEDVINALILHPILLERPIVVKNYEAVLGRPPENVLILM